MGMEMRIPTMSDAHREHHRSEIARRGNAPIPSAPDGPVLESFKALDLAQAIEREISRGVDNGLTKIRFDMTFKDAADIAAFMRRAALLGA